MTSITREDILNIHNYYVKSFNLTKGFQNKGNVDSTLKSIEVNGSDDILYNAAILLESLIRLHPFIDANKRTAVHSTIEYLSMGGLVLGSGRFAKVFLNEIAGTQGTEPEIIDMLRASIWTWIGANTVPMVSDPRP